jgi:DNA-binding NarL/FixJ family response regulator
MRMAVADASLNVEPLRVLLADDHPAFRGSVRALVDATAGLEVAGEAATGLEAVEQAISLHPDVILMDIHMPGLNGVLATHKIVKRSPHIGVVIFTVNPVGDVLFAGLQRGPSGADRALAESTRCYPRG